MISPQSCWQTGATSLLVAGSVPGEPTEGAVAVLQGQGQSVTDVAGAGPLRVVSATSQVGCVSDGASQYYPVDLADGTVGSASPGGCPVTSTNVDMSDVLQGGSVGGRSTRAESVQQTAASNALIPPSVTFSYYEYLAYAGSCGSGATTGCTLYVQGQSTETRTSDGLVILDFGSQCNTGATYGVQMFGSTTCTADATVHQLVQEWISGYESDHGAASPNITVGVGTSSSLTAADPSTGYEPASLQTAGADWYHSLVGAAYSGGSAPFSVWGASDMEEAADGEWYDGADTIDWVGGYSGAAFPTVPASDCALAQGGFLADFGDFNSSGLVAAGWSENQVYDVSQGITGTCAVPEIYYNGDAPEWVSLSQWAVSEGSPAIDFTAVMVEPGGSATCPPASGSTLLSASCAWTQLETQTGQVPDIPGITQIATALQGAGPQVTGVSPSYGAEAGGTAVTISGSGFLGTQTVYFGSTAVTASSGDVNSAGTSITIDSPAASPSVVNLVVVTGLGSSSVTPADNFQFVAPACTAVTASLDAASAAPGFSDVVTASATCPTGAEAKYSYFTEAGSSGLWILRAAWIGSTWNWQTAGLAQGAYAVLVWASDGPYTLPQVQAVADLTLATQAACTAVSSTALPTAVVSGSEVEITGVGTCPTGSLPEYSYFTRLGTTDSWNLAAAWIGPSWSWSTTGLPAGSYEVLVWVSDGPYSAPQAQAESTVTISALVACSGLSVSVPTSVLQGQPAAVVATATCPTGTSALFSYFIAAAGAPGWTLETAWVGPTWTLQTGSLSPGTYQVLAWVSDGPYTVPQAQAVATLVVDPVAACTALSVVVPSPATTGLPVSVAATATCPTGSTPLYSYFVRSGSAASWTLKAAWIGSTWSWQTAELSDGEYQVLVWVSDGPYSAPQQQATATVLLDTQAPCSSVSVSTAPTTFAAGQPVIVSAAGTCPAATVPRYSYFTSPSLNGPWTLQDAWTGPTWTWSTAGLGNGTYYILVWVSGAEYQLPEAQATATVTVSTPPACTGLTAMAAPSTVTAGESVVITAAATCPTGTTALYSYFTAPSESGPWTLQDAWTSDTWTWGTVGLAGGGYYVLVWASDGPYTVPQVEVLQGVQVNPIAACSQVTLSVPSSISSGQPINATATATCPSGAQVEYSYFTETPGSGTWVLQAAWIGPEWTWNTVGFAPGSYQVLVWASDGPYTAPQVEAVATISVSG